MLTNNQISETGQTPSGQVAREPRRRVLMGAKLLLNGNQSVIDCVVRDLSETGAKVKFTQPTTLPRYLDLLIIKDNLRFAAEVRWNRNGEAGLKLTSAGKANIRNFSLPDRRRERAARPDEFPTSA